MARFAIIEKRWMLIINILRKIKISNAILRKKLLEDLLVLHRGRLTAKVGIVIHPVHQCQLEVLYT